MVLSATPRKGQWLLLVVVPNADRACCRSSSIRERQHVHHLPVPDVACMQASQPLTQSLLKQLIMTEKE